MKYLAMCVCIHNNLCPLHTASLAGKKGTYVLVSYVLYISRGKASHINKMANVLIPLVAQTTLVSIMSW